MAALTRCPRASLVLAVLLSILTSFLPGPTSAEPQNPTGQVTVFWGRHKDEGSLREACDSGTYTTVIICFLNVDGHGRYHLDLSGHPLAGVGGDIKHCQSLGVAVSLSIGGNHSLPTNQSALDLSDHLWNAFLGGSRRGVRRPFGDAAWLDGVDLFLERGTPVEHYDILAGELAKRGDIGGSETGKPLQLTATPRCAFPAESVAAAGVLERIHVRFYGDDHGDCNLYSEQEWDKWTVAYPSSRIYLGQPASPEAAREGYLYPKSLYYGVLPVVQMAPNYGGVMI